MIPNSIHVPPRLETSEHIFLVEAMERSQDQLVLIVDDDESVLRAMGRFLQSAGFRVKTFSSGKAFLDSEFQKDNACLIVDVKMPEMNGLELYQKLLDQGIHLPVIFITAYDTVDIRKKAHSLGAASYFRKPVDGQALIDSIHWAITQNQETP